MVLLFGSAALILILARPAPDPAGDIADYYGTTETILRHGSLDLRASDIERLSVVLHPGYFSNPGYYIPGTDGNRYPFHFIAYPLLLVPVRIILELAHISPLHVFGVMNLLIFVGMLLFLLKRFTNSVPRKELLVLLALTSPLLFFINWPGPDILVMSLVLAGLCYWLSEIPFTAAVIFSFASWHSQPVAALSVATLAYGFLNNKYLHHKISFKNKIIWALGVLIVLVLPYAYNLSMFGTVSPWLTETDQWTRLYGFGLQNLSVQKLFEQFFDLNIGVFWYAPLLVLLGIGSLMQKMKTAIGAWVGGSLLVTLFAFQTNPAWHYGTAGFGPTRHALILIPFLIAALSLWGSTKPRFGALIGVVIVTQLYVLSINNYIFPLFTNTLFHSPLAAFVLDRWPSWYNPTPEIFTDRTNHDDPDHPETAIYRDQTRCLKAYVLPRDIETVIDECGPFPERTSGSVFRSETDGFYVNYAK